MEIRPMTTTTSITTSIETKLAAIEFVQEEIIAKRQHYSFSRLVADALDFYMKEKRKKLKAN